MKIWIHVESPLSGPLDYLDFSHDYPDSFSGPEAMIFSILLWVFKKDRPWNNQCLLLVDGLVMKVLLGKPLARMSKNRISLSCSNSIMNLKPLCRLLIYRKNSLAVSLLDSVWSRGCFGAPANLSTSRERIAGGPEHPRLETAEPMSILSNMVAMCRQHTYSKVNWTNSTDYYPF